MTIQSHANACSPEAKAALATLAEVMAEDFVTRYVARPGHQLQFFTTLLGEFTQLNAYTIYQTADCNCVALVHKVSPDAAQAGADEGAQKQEGPCGEATDGAMCQGGVRPLLELGLVPAQAQLLSLVQPGRRKALQQLETEVDDVMKGYAKEHGELLHLHFIATSSRARGRGLGARMLAHLGQIADAQGLCMYLEASSHASRRLYERHGFRDVRTFQLGEEGGGGPVFHIMLRQPAGAAGEVAAAGAAAATAAA